VKTKSTTFMLLQPKKTKYKKMQKGKLLRFDFRSNKLKFGSIGLKAAKAGTISSRQVEAARQAIVRKLNRKGKL
jgi:large subunit ribosomal protein L16